jgi:hypothetical protein
MRLEFTSAHRPSTPTGRRQLSYWPGGLLLAAGLILYLPDSRLGDMAGQVLAVVGGCLLANTMVARRKAAARPEPRHWTITDEDLEAASQLGSVRWTWTQVQRAEEHPDAYLLYQSESPHTAAFDVPRDTLSPADDAAFRTFLTDRGLLPST